MKKQISLYFFVLIFVFSLEYASGVKLVADAKFKVGRSCEEEPGFIEDMHFIDEEGRLTRFCVKIEDFEEGGTYLEDMIIQDFNENNVCPEGTIEKGTFLAHFINKPSPFYSSLYEYYLSDRRYSVGLRTYGLCAKFGQYSDTESFKLVKAIFWTNLSCRNIPPEYSMSFDEKFAFGSDIRDNDEVNEKLYKSSLVEIRESGKIFSQKKYPSFMFKLPTNGNNIHIKFRKWMLCVTYINIHKAQQSESENDNSQEEENPEVRTVEGPLESCGLYDYHPTRILTGPSGKEHCKSIDPDFYCKETFFSKVARGCDLPPPPLFWDCRKNCVRCCYRYFNVCDWINVTKNDYSEVGITICEKYHNRSLCKAVNIPGITNCTQPTPFLSCKNCLKCCYVVREKEIGNLGPIGKKDGPFDNTGEQKICEWYGMPGGLFGRPRANAHCQAKGAVCTETNIFGINDCNHKSPIFGCKKCVKCCWYPR